MSKILVISMRVPYPPWTGYQVTMLNYLKAISDLGHTITLISVDDTKPAESESLKERIKETVPGITDIHFIFPPKTVSLFSAILGYLVLTPLQVGYFSNFYSRRKLSELVNLEDYDHILIHTIRLSKIIPQRFLKKSVLFYADSIAMNYYSARKTIKGLYRWLFRFEAPILKRYEKIIHRYLGSAIFHNSIDADFLNIKTRVSIIPILKPVSPVFQEIDSNTKKRFLFIGKLSYLPNLDAVQRLVQYFKNASNEIFDIDFIGEDLPAVVIKEIETIPNMHYLGPVIDISAEIKNSYGMLSPMIMGAGMTNKILDAIVNGRPAVASVFSATPYIKYLNSSYHEAESGILSFETLPEMHGTLVSLIEDVGKANRVSLSAYKTAEKFDSKNLSTYLDEGIQTSVS